MPKIYRIPFASAGDKQAIPISTDPIGFVSDETGFTTRYELPESDPSYLPIERAEFNGLMNDITSALGEVQQFGFAKWQAGSWPKGARVVHNEVVYKATTTTANTPPHADWVKDQGDQTDIVQVTGQSTTAVMSQKAVTDALGSAGTTGSKAANGYVKFDNDVILQWGKVDAVPALSTNNGVDIGKAVSFPIAFPTICASITIAPTDGTVDRDSDMIIGIVSTTGFKIAKHYDRALNAHWMAIGY